MRHAGALVAASLATLLAMAPHAIAQEPLTARSAIDFRVIVPSFVRVSAAEHPQTLEVTLRDAERGYVDLEGASFVRVTSNARAGFTVAASFARELLSRVELRVPRQNGLLVDVPVRISYRLYLNSGTAAGTYRWPVALSFGAHAA